eukprot:563002-Prymnesium_polylepis.1
MSASTKRRLRSCATGLTSSVSMASDGYRSASAACVRPKRSSTACAHMVFDAVDRQSRSESGLQWWHAASTRTH